MIFILKKENKVIKKIYSTKYFAPGSFDIDLFNLSNYYTGSDMSPVGKLSVSNNQIYAPYRIRFSTKTDIIDKDYYTLEFDLYAPESNRKWIYFCCTNTSAGTSKNWNSVLGNGYVGIGVDVSNTAIEIRKNGAGTFYNGNFSNNIMGFKGTKHVVFKRRGDLASISIGGNVILDNLDVSGLANGIAGWKWNDGSFSMRNIEIKTPLEVEFISKSGKQFFNKRNPSVEFTFTGTTLTQYNTGSFTGSNMFIDYGDGTVEATNGTFGHTYAQNGNYTVKIYGVTSLGSHCFRNCTGITNINISDNITSIGHSCFENCTGLTSITLPDSVTSLGEFCFYNCTGLTSITIPNSVTSIGYSCFEGCTGLTSITLPDSVTSLGEYCFCNCTNLANIILNWITSNTIITYNSNWITNANANLKFEIPKDTTQLYIDKGYPSTLLEEDSI